MTPKRAVCHITWNGFRMPSAVTEGKGVVFCLIFFCESTCSKCHFGSSVWSIKSRKGLCGRRLVVGFKSNLSHHQADQAVEMALGYTWIHVDCTHCCGSLLGPGGSTQIPPMFCSQVGLGPATPGQLARSSGTCCLQRFLCCAAAQPVPACRLVKFVLNRSGCTSGVSALRKVNLEKQHPRFLQTQKHINLGE